VQIELVGPEGTSRALAAEAASLARLPMQRHDDGWHECVLDEAGPGSRYLYHVGPGQAVPDPASRFNPLDVHGPSEVIDPLSYQWLDEGWRGRPWHTATIYELHVGTFTPEGNLAAAAARLPQLHALGISAVQLMPLAHGAGTRGWGYDGVLPFALHPSYGRPDDLKRFVDTAHGLGLMIMLDVVYNHFGPDGNYLPSYCPEFHDPSRRTPWGSAINFDGPASETVRRYYIENALYWVEEYRIDGLRLDAVHAIQDGSPRHIVEDIASALHRGPGRERWVHLVLENDANNARWLERDATGRPLVASAQWNDDWHHSAHVLATGESAGYYSDFAAGPATLLGRSLAEGFVYQGQPSPYRGGEPRGEPSSALPSQAFVSFLQNHDQIGNRALGERLDANAARDRVEALLACLLLAPHVPMLFMGEEFAATTPFLYFCDFQGELASAVAQGRRDGFKTVPAFRDALARSRIPDPNAASTFAASKLRHDEGETGPGRRRLALVKRLLALRREHLEPLLPLQPCGGTLRSGEGWFAVEWAFGLDARWAIRANFGADALTLETTAGEHEVYRTAAALASRPRVQLASDQLLVSVWRRPGP
jgi:maltooligosyltrehalose trehalohydrolase